MEKTHDRRERGPQRRENMNHAIGKKSFSLKVPRSSGRNVDSHWVACRISLPWRTILVQGCRFWIDVAAVSDGGYRRGSDSSVDEASWGSLSPGFW
ncbi:hypothetical protein LINPERHAP2_LOCUS37588 [Linum perenne]